MWTPSWFISQYLQLTFNRGVCIYSLFSNVCNQSVLSLMVMVEMVSSSAHWHVDHNVNQIITQHTLAHGSLPRSLWNGHYAIYIKVQFSIPMWPCDPWLSFRVFSDCNFFGPFFRENTVLNATQCDWLVIVPPRTPSLTVFIEEILEGLHYKIIQWDTCTCIYCIDRTYFDIVATSLLVISYFSRYVIFVLMLDCLLCVYVFVQRRRTLCVRRFIKINLLLLLKV